MSAGFTNPFKFGSDIAKGEYFADREKEIRELKQQLKDGARIVLFAARRYGKTALIMNVLDELANEKHLTAYFDVSTAPDKSLFVSKYKSLPDGNITLHRPRRKRHHRDAENGKENMKLKKAQASSAATGSHPLRTGARRENG